MTLTDNFLVEMAKALAEESYTVPSHLAFATTEVASIATTDTALSGEIGTREALSKSRSDKSITFTAMRSGTDVIDTTNGDELESSGFLNASTNGTFLWGITHPGITQTTVFDLEWEVQIDVRRV